VVEFDFEMLLIFNINDVS